MAPSTSSDTYDVIVIGGGNAGFSAANTAAETLRSFSPHSDHSDYQPRILVIEKAPRAEAGGNTYHTAGAYRFCFDGFASLLPILSYNGYPGLPEALASRVEMAPYTESDFLFDLNRVTSNRADPELAKILVSRSREAVDWMAAHGGQWELSFHRQAYEVEGKFKFWGGLVVCFAGGGKGLISWHEELARREGVEVRYGCSATRLLVDETGDHSPGKVIGVEVLQEGNDTITERLYATGGVVLASGGFQASPNLRSSWLSPSWSTAHVRGNPYSTGDGHTMALSPHISAIRAGDYGHSACHSTCWDAASPPNGGNRTLTNAYTKSGYPLGIMVNTCGERFVDEGQDLRNYTYAVFGRKVLEQDGGRAWQIWDDEQRQLLRKEEYGEDVTTLITADSIQDLAMLLNARGMAKPEVFIQTVNDFNAACIAFQHEHPEIKFDPSTRDGLSTQQSDTTTKKLAFPKSNWARPLLHPPFVAVEITCGITFTFGGLKVVPSTAEVLRQPDHEHDNDNATPLPVPVGGLYACGEILGGLFWGNYPGGSGLTAGTVFGRIAGAHAAREAWKVQDSSSSNKNDH